MRSWLDLRSFLPGLRTAWGWPYNPLRGDVNPGKKSSKSN